jgi:hypothetical protein
MSEILSEIQAGYVQRARMAAYVSVTAPERRARPKATRTYTGAPLARRRAWGVSWGAIVSERAKELT